MSPVVGDETAERQEMTERIKEKSKDVKVPNKQTIPPTHQGLELSRKQDPATPVSGFAGAHSGLGRDAAFKLPDRVSQKEIKDQSFKYGGGRGPNGSGR